MKSFSIILTITFIFISSSIAQITFEKKFGGVYDDLAYFVQQTYDGGYIVTGLTEVSTGLGKAFLTKFNSHGDSLWTKTFSKGSRSAGFSVQQTRDSGFIIAGDVQISSQYDVYVIKTDANGDTLWTKTVGGSDDDFARSVQQTSDDGFIVGGYTRSFNINGDYDFYLVKLKANGDTLWTKTIGGEDDDYGRSVQQTKDGGYIITGFKLNLNTLLLRAYLVKTYADGTITWEKTFEDLTLATSVQQTKDKGYILTGKFNGEGFLIKTNEDGDSIWAKNFSSEMRDATFARQTNNGYIVVGNGIVGENIALIKTDTIGNMLWKKTFAETGSASGHCVQLTNDGGYIISGAVVSFGAVSSDAYLIKTDDNGVVGIEEQSSGALGIKIYPNPSDGYLTVSLSPNFNSDVTFQIVNSLGKIVKSESRISFRAVHIDLSNQPSGIYFLNVLSKGMVIASKKLVIY